MKNTNVHTRDNYLRAYFGTFLFLVIVIAAMLAAKLIMLPDEPLFSSEDMSAVAAMASASLRGETSAALPPVVTEQTEKIPPSGQSEAEDITEA